MLSKKIYFFKGINASGEKINGTIEAKNFTEFKKILAAEHIALLSKKIIYLSAIKKRIRPTTIDNFLYRLCFLIRAKISLIDSLTLLLKSEEKIETRWLIQQIKTSLEKGMALSKTFAKFPEFFNSTACSLIHLSEHSSHLHVTLDKILAQRKKTRLFQQQIKKAMIYPTIVLSTAIIICALMLIFVVPNFEKIYGSFQIKLPLLTRILINLSNNLHHHSLSLLFGIFILISSIVIGKKHPIFKLFLEKILQKTPYIKSLIEIHTLYYWCYSLAETINAGIPLLTALSLAERSVGYFSYRKKFQRISSTLKEGELLHQAIEQTNLFSKDIIGLIQIAEKTGKLNQALNEIAIRYYTKLNNHYEKLNKLIEPAITLFIALFTGTLVIALYWPIFNLGELF